MEGFRILVSSNTDLLEQKKILHKKKAYLSGLVWNTTTVAVIVLGHECGRRDVM